MPLDIAKEIRDQIEQLRNRNFEPAFILLGRTSYELLCNHTAKEVQALGKLEEQSFAMVTIFDSIPVVFTPDVHEFYVKVLPNANDFFLYLQQEQFRE